MERYDPNRGCPKCGKKTVDRWIYDDDTILRQCSCNYEWKEEPLDTEVFDFNKG